MHPPIPHASYAGNHGQGLVGTALTAGCSMWLTPMATRQFYRNLNKIAAAELTAEIQPRVFEEQFPNKIIYVGDMIAGPVVRWRHVFLADVTPAEQRKEAGRKAALTRKRRQAGAKAALTRKRRAAAKKAAQTRAAKKSTQS